MSVEEQSPPWLQWRRVMTKVKAGIEGYEDKAQCVNCEEITECIVLKFKDYSGPHCEKCVMREVRKRAKPANGGNNGSHA